MPPLPTGEVWVQFPLIAVIVSCFALAAVAIFTFTKWIWNEYKKERDKDLAWRERQNQIREAANTEQNRLWREAMVARDVRWENQDEKKQAALQDLAGMMERMIELLGGHDQQAKHILEITQRVDENTRPLSGSPSWGQRKSESE